MKPPRPSAEIPFPLITLKQPKFRKREISIDWGIWNEARLSPTKRAEYEALWDPPLTPAQKHAYVALWSQT